MEPVTLTELVTATRAETSGLDDGRITVRRVSVDSRTLEAGDLFWAICGKQHDGHDFVSEARRRGAPACVVQRDRTRVSGPRVIVGDTQAALGEFAAWYRQRCEALVIGVTGSVGKTTTREMIHAVLSASHTGLRSRFNYNNEIGLPLSLLELGAGDEYGVFEMGAARAGDIRRLCQIAQPEIGVLTPIGPAHLDSFGTLDCVYIAKAELLEALPRHGFAVVVGDDDAMRSLAARATCPVVMVGERPENSVRASDVDFRPGRLRFAVDGKRYELAAPARHYLTAALCALAVAREIGMEHAAICEGFSRFVGQPGRCAIERTAAWTIIDDTYNANPLSMQAACLCLRDWPEAAHKLLIAGDMLELGPTSGRSHQELGACIAAARVDRLLAFGASSGEVSRGALRAGMKPHNIAECRDLDALLAVLDCWIEPGDVVLVKGSRAMKMERVVQWLKKRAEPLAKSKTRDAA